MSPLNVREIYPSRWLAAEDIIRPVIVTITAATVEEVREPRGNGMTRKLCLAFARATKRMLLNKTQALAIAELYGADAEKWPGQAIQLLPARSSNGRPTIEVRSPPQHAPDAPAPATPAPAAAPSGSEGTQPAETGPAGPSAPAPEPSPATDFDDLTTAAQERAATPAAQIIARLRTEAEFNTTKDGPQPPDEHLLKKTRANIANLVGADVAKSKALVKQLFEHDSSSQLTRGECDTICDWINCRKFEGKEWVPSAKSIDEYKILTNAEGPLISGAAA